MTSIHVSRPRSKQQLQRRPVRDSASDWRRSSASSHTRGVHENHPLSCSHVNSFNDSSQVSSCDVVCVLLQTHPYTFVFFWDVQSLWLAVSLVTLFVLRCENTHTHTHTHAHTNALSVITASHAHHFLVRITRTSNPGLWRCESNASWRLTRELLNRAVRRRSDNANEMKCAKPPNWRQPLPLTAWSK
jgi:hypothetical protein